MPQLIQLIGPCACGKTTLRRMMAPNAVDISGFLGSVFNRGMENYKDGYHFEEIQEHQYEKLEHWLNAELIRIEIMGDVPIHVPNIGPWIYLGLSAIPIENTLIWRVAKYGQ